MSSVPPNNPEQLLAWVRVFMEETTVQFQALEKKITHLTTRIRRIENEQSR